MQRNPLEIPEILQKVLEHFSPSTLKKCREVSSIWDENACTILWHRSGRRSRGRAFDQRNEFLELHIQRSPPYTRAEPRTNIEYSVDDLRPFMAKLMHRHQHHPMTPGFFPRISFLLNTKYLHEPRVQSFLSEFGQFFRILTIKFYNRTHELRNSPPVFDLLRNLLINQASNIEHLFLDVHWIFHHSDLTTGKRTRIFPERSSRSTISPDSGSLPNLKKLTVLNIEPLESCWEMVREFLNNAPNLQEFEAQCRSDDDDHDNDDTSLHQKKGHKLARALNVGGQGKGRWVTADFIDILRETGKMTAVRTMTFAPGLPDFHGEDDQDRVLSTIPVQYTGLSKLDKLARARPALNTLFINMELVYGFEPLYRDCARTLQQILEASANSLETLILSPLEFLQQLRVPPLTNLKTLVLYGGSSDGMQVFPQQSHWTIQFPGLKTLVFHWTVDQETFDTFLDYFEEEEDQDSSSASTVEEIRILASGDVWDPAEDLPRLSNVGKNIRKLVIDPHDEGSLNLPLTIKTVLDTFKELRVLKLKGCKLEWDGKSRGQLIQKFMQIDAAILGVSTSQLKKHPGNWNATGTSLASFKDFQFLSVQLNVGRWWDFVDQSTALKEGRLFSRSAETLKKIPRVQIRISGTAKKGDWGMKSPADFTGVKAIIAPLFSHLESDWLSTEFLLESFMN